MKLHLLFPFILLFIIKIQPQQNNFNFEFDYAQFGFDSTSNYIEFYYSFNQSSLTLQDTDSISFVEGTLTITIADSLTGEIFLDKTWSVKNPVIDSANANRSLIGMISFILNEGSYNCSIIGSDAVNPNLNNSITELIRVKPFLTDKISLSDVQLASKILKDSQNKESIF